VRQGGVKVKQQPNLRGEKPGDVELIAYIGDAIFVVEFKTQGDAASTAMAARRTRQFAEQLKMKATPLVAVPYMGEVGQRLCDEAGVCWLDLSGNAHLFGPPGLRV